MAHAAWGPVSIFTFSSQTKEEEQEERKGEQQL